MLEHERVNQQVQPIEIRTIFVRSSPEGGEMMIKCLFVFLLYCSKLFWCLGTLRSCLGVCGQSCRRSNFLSQSAAILPPVPLLSKCNEMPMPSTDHVSSYQVHAQPGPRPLEILPEGRVASHRIAPDTKGCGLCWTLGC